MLVVSVKYVVVHRRQVVTEVGAEVHVQVLAHIEDLHHGIVVDRNAVGHAICNRSHFLFTMGVDPLLALCLGSIPQLLQEGGEVLLDVLGIAEAGGVDCHKAVADLALSAGHAVVGGRALGQDGCEDLAEHAVAIALVAAQLLSGCAGPRQFL